MSRRKSYKMTDAEMMKCKYNKPCPLRACKGRAAQMALSRASWKECTTCGHQWEFRGGGNKIITREQKDELVGRRLGGRGSGEAEERRAVARRREQYRQEASEMAKSKKPVAKRKTAKTTKAAKRKTTKAGLSMCGFIREFAKKNPKASNEDIAKATKAAVGVLPATATVTIQSNKGRKG